MQRRDLLRAMSALAASGFAHPALLQAKDDELLLRTVGDAQPFNYAWLKGRARELAAAPYADEIKPLPDAIAALNWDQWQAITYRPDHALWGQDKLRIEAKFFHLGPLSQGAVRMHEVHDGMAAELAYDAAMFDYGKSGVNGKKLPKDLGFNGFRLNFHTDLKRDVAAFQGASYFRAVGGEWQYGQSARGLAIDTGMPRPEEFPRFTDYWLERPAADSPSVTVYGLLDSPSIAGAYRFVLTPGDKMIIDVDAALYPRTEIERMGIAPLTSMYQTGENDKRLAYDWRPEIHDTDGLCMWTGSGEWIWRPLTNPRTLQFNAFADQNPRGFGLLQRDRNFDHYQDDGVFYDRRPSVWIEPKGEWGKGSIDLVEIPTVDETFDNIVAFWNPDAAPVPGEELLYAYRMTWAGIPPVASPMARAVDTFTGLGGVVGQKRPYFSWRFAVDFAGGDFSMLGADSKVEPVIEASAGRVEITSARPQHEIHGWRAMFDLVPPDDSTTPITIRMYLQSEGQPLTETWLYQWVPPPPAERILY